jgi:hypothetical protein
MKQYYHSAAIAIFIAILGGCQYSLVNAQESNATMTAQGNATMTAQGSAAMPAQSTAMMAAQKNVTMAAINGQWTLHYSWGCSGSYTQVGITFNTNGAFSIPSQNLAGKWVQNDGMILFQFDTSKTTYGGNVAGNAMVGMQSTFTGSNGCWYATK